MTDNDWSGRRAQDALRYVKTKGRRNNEPCCICQQPINYDLKRPDPMSCSVQHIKSRHRYPHLTWVRSNWGPSHLACNQAAGTDGGTELGITSPI